MRDDALARCQAAIGIQFKNPDLLASALTHASIANNRLESNERMEFLGDSVLGMVVCTYLFEKYPEYLEGELTKIKSTVVSGKTCAQISEDLGLSEHLFLGNGISARSKLPTSVMAAVFESLIAAIYLDAGVEVARKFILKFLTPHIDHVATSEHHHNFKSQLQQHAQRDMSSTPVYELLDEKGPDHSKCFEVAVCIAGRRFPSAWGPNKKEAEQKAAYNALLDLNMIQQEIGVFESVQSVVT
ncbi:MAG TPA: ribonuclease III [Phycisphaerae bacterium]|nr:ribonuclease III [Phycisphaerae bacterium]